MQWFLYLGVLCFFITGLCVGAWTSGDQQRANFHLEPKEDRKLKHKVAIWSALVGIVSFAVVGLLYFLS